MTPPDDALLRRPFDHYARYRLAAEIVEATAGSSARVLDLGGGPGSLQAFLPDADVTATDIVAPSTWHAQAPSLVLADGAALPFADDAFDVVVSLDTLEHVVPASRGSFLDEVARVAARWALVVCPFGTPGVADADIALREYVKNRFAPDLPTIAILDEHIGHGHPDLAESRRRLAAHGPVATLPSGRLDRWFAGMLTFFHLLAIGDDEPVEVVQRFYNRTFYAADLAEPAYRHGLVLRTGDDDGDPHQIVSAFTQRAAADPAADADLDLLRVALTESLVAATARANAEAVSARQATADIESRLTATAEAERRARAHVEELEAARAEDAQAMAELRAAHDELAAFRDAVMAHPVVRLRDLAGRMTRRMGRR